MRFDGLIPAVVLPMAPDFSIDEPGLRRYLDWISGQGVLGVAVNVDTGETAHLEHAEKVRVVEVARDQLPSSQYVVTGLTGPYNAAAVRQARDFKAAGADAVLVFPIPAYLSRPLDSEVPYSYHADIAEVGLPIILFQLQEALGGVKYESATFERLLTIDQVVAVKEANFDALHFVNVLNSTRRVRPDVAVLTGNDNFMYESMVLGADGGLLGFGAIMTQPQVDMIALARTGDYAKAKDLGARLQRVADEIFSLPVSKYRARLKEVLCMQGILQSAAIRPPLLALSDAERSRLQDVLKASGDLWDGQ
jgi:4-hydroxy-tetrahydrodipicolinate synthase